MRPLSVMTAQVGCDLLIRMRHRITETTLVHLGTSTVILSLFSYYKAHTFMFWFLFIHPSIFCSHLSSSGLGGPGAYSGVYSVYFIFLHIFFCICNLPDFFVSCADKDSLPISLSSLHLVKRRAFTQISYPRNVGTFMRVQTHILKVRGQSRWTGLLIIENMIPLVIIMPHIFFSSYKH